MSSKKGWRQERTNFLRERVEIRHLEQSYNPKRGQTIPIKSFKATIRVGEGVDVEGKGRTSSRN